MLEFDAMRTFLADLAADWLERTLFPMAAAAARLPEATTTEDVRNLHLPQPDHAFAAHSAAVMHCAGLQLVGASLIAAQLAQSERAAHIAQSILGLAWRDALELATARDLEFDSGTAGFPTAEFEVRHDQAQAAWARWLATDPEVGRATTAFLAACGEAWDDSLFM